MPKQLKLALGAMSPESVEAAFRYQGPLALISSMNQISERGGYTGWTTREYAAYVGQLRERYPESRIMLCRDHLGPGYGVDTLDEVYATVESDLAAGFDLIHVDLSRIPAAERLAQSARLIEHCRKRARWVRIEIGTDENESAEPLDEQELARTAAFFQPYAAHYYVLRTGSRVMEDRQVGAFAVQDEHVRILRRCGYAIKEHNADWLSAGQIRERAGKIDALNIAPQIGVVQTSFLLHQALLYGIDTRPFVDLVSRGVCWHKWDCGRLEHDPSLRARVAGHYHVTSDEYRSLYAQVAECMPLREALIAEHGRLIQHYMENLENC